MIIDLRRFIEQEEPYWRELENMLHRLETDPAATSDFGEIRRFHYLYQRCAADLVKLRTFASEPAAERQVEALVARAYGRIHASRSRAVRFNPLRWVAQTWPRAVRRHGWLLAASLLVAVAGMFLGGLFTLLDADTKRILVPAQFAHVLDDPSQQVADAQEASRDAEGRGYFSFSSMLIQNNIKVSLLAVGAGFFWGAGTIILLFYNFAIVGLVFTDFVRAGEGAHVFAWLLPHGTIELSAIVLAGQAGLLLGDTVIGRGSMLALPDRLRRIAPDLITLIGGVAIMLVWAGIIESFLSQHHHPGWYPWKIAFGAVEFVLLCGFLALAGQRRQTARTTTTEAAHA